jgi:SNF2 family DNA or RNA helicase
MRDVPSRVCSISFERYLLTASRLASSAESYCRSCALAHSATQRTSNDPRYRSAKIRQIIKIVVDVEKKPNPGKTIVFSDFVKMLDIVAYVLNEERIRFVRCE